MQVKKLEDLDLLDDFMFFKTLENKEIGEQFGRVLLEIIFNRKFGKLQVVPQKVYYGADPEKHGIRLDVYLEEEISSETLLEEAIIADIEPESASKENEKESLPKRVRFYHSKIDANILGSGADYRSLKKVIVVMIMPFDPFDYDQVIYTIQNTCLEVPELPFDDGAKTMFLYTRGKHGNVSRGVKELLHYMEESTEENATNEALREIHGMVSRVKQKVEVSREYMKWIELQRMWQRQGYESGRLEGQVEGEIIGRIKVARKYGISEQEVVRELMEEYHLTEEEAEEAWKKYS